MNSFHHGRDSSYRIQYLNGQGWHNEFISRSIPYASALAYAFASSLFIYFLLAYLNLISLSASSRLAWKIIVMIIPTSVISVLDQKSEQAEDAKCDLGAQNVTGAAAKEQAIRRILGLDKGSFFLEKTKQRYATYGKHTANLVPPGLGNLNNSCYQNSVIQGLASFRRLDSFLENNIRALNLGQRMSTHISLKETIEKLNDLSSGSRRMWLPRELKSMSSWQQQDAQEYFSKVIEQIDKEINQVLYSRISDNGFQVDGIPSDGDQASSFGTLGHSILRRTGATELTGPFDNPLEGLAAQRVGCTTCGYCEGLSLIPFTCLTVPLSQRQEHDVGTCLDEYTALEPIEGVECAKCTALHVEAGILKVFNELESRDLSQLEPSERAHHETIKALVERRLDAIKEALFNEDFSEKTLNEVFRLNAKQRVSTTKSRQSVIAKAPKSLVIHINRSMFDELTGRLLKNSSRVTFPDVLELDEWCLGSKRSEEIGVDAVEYWDTDPRKSMLSSPGTEFRTFDRRYELRAVITHYGRHDDGHYVCYRKFATEPPLSDPDPAERSIYPKEVIAQQWFELNDAYVAPVSHDFVLSQGGVFMLFYEMIEPSETPTISGLSDSSSNRPQKDGL